MNLSNTRFEGDNNVMIYLEGVSFGVTIEDIPKFKFFLGHEKVIHIRKDLTINVSAIKYVVYKQ